VQNYECVTVCRSSIAPPATGLPVSRGPLPRQERKLPSIVTGSSPWATSVLNRRLIITNSVDPLRLHRPRQRRRQPQLSRPVGEKLRACLKAEACTANKLIDFSAVAGIAAFVSFPSGAIGGRRALSLSRHRCTCAGSVHDFPRPKHIPHCNTREASRMQLPRSFSHGVGPSATAGPRT
jgi:hypothetical protein